MCALCDGKCFKEEAKNPNFISVCLNSQNSNPSQRLYQSLPLREHI